MTQVPTQIRLGDIVPANTPNAAFADARVAPELTSDIPNAVVSRTIKLMIASMNTQTREVKETAEKTYFDVSRYAEWLQGLPSDHTPVYIGQQVNDRIVDGNNSWVSGRSPKTEGTYVPYPTDTAVQWVGQVYQNFTVSDPVNQVPNVRAWHDRLAIFAHHLDLAHGSYTVDVELGEAARATLFLYGQMLIGNALDKIDEWAVIDPLHKFVRNGETILSWKDREPSVENAVMAIGADHWWARLMAEHADLPLFNVSLGHGRLQAVNRNAAQWVPGSVIAQAQMPPPSGNPPVLPSPEQRALAIATWLTETAARWRKARNHYDTVIGPREAAFEARLRKEYFQ